MLTLGKRGGFCLPSDESLRFTRQSKFLWEAEAFSPVHNLTVGVGGVFSAEWRPSHETLEHDGSNRPPIAQIGIPLTVEDFRCNVVRRSDCRVRHGTARFPPGVDLATVGYRQVDGIIEISRITVLVLGCRVLEEILVVGVIMRLLAAGRKTEIRELDVTTTVKQNVIRFNVTGQRD